MVAVRGSHLLNPKDFVIEKWCAELGLAPQVEQALALAWHYSQQKVSEFQAKEAVSYNSCHLQIGVEMVEILHGLNMDADSLLTAMLYPIVSNNIVDLATLKDDFGANIGKLVKGVMEMDNIRQLNVNSANSLQVDNVRRMLLAMVDDFRCVIIKLAERITFCVMRKNTVRKKKKCWRQKNAPIFMRPLPIVWALGS